MNVVPQYKVIGPYNYDRIIIICHDFLPTPRRGSHVKSGKTHTDSNQDTPLSPYT